MEFLLIGIATAFNVMILKWKLDRGRSEDPVVDVTVLVALSWLFGGTLGGLIIAMVASAIISLYLIVSPPAFLKEL